MRPLLRSALALVACLGAAPLAAQGRPAGVGNQRLRDMAVGTVIPGVVTMFGPGDAVRAGQWSVTGSKGAQIECFFTLPTALVGPGGARIPITFGSTSAGYTLTGTNADLVLHDPRTRFTATLSGNGRGFVYLGAILSPPGTIPAGAYATTISLTIAYTGL